MAGFFGDSWEDPKSQAIMALAGGLMGGDWKKGLLDYGSTMSASKEADFKKKLQQAQMDKYAADTDMDRQKLSLSQGKEKRDSEFEAFFQNALKQRFGGGGVATPNMPVTGSQGGQGVSQGGMPNGGQSFGGDPFAGVDPTALMFDHRNNQGKNIGGWINDASKPQKREQGSTYIDPRTGVERVFPKIAEGMMPNAQGVYGFAPGYSEAQIKFEADKAREIERAKNNFNFREVTVPGGGTSLESNTSLADRVNGTQPQARPTQVPMGQPVPAAPNGQQGYTSEGQMRNTVAGGMGADPQALAREIKATAIALQTVPDQKSKQELYGYLQDLQKQAVNLQKQPSLAPTQPPQAAPSFGLPLQSLSEKERTSAENKAYETKLVEQTKADTQPTQAKQANISAAENAISLIDKALTHQGLGVATGLSGAIDPRNYVPGQVGKDYKAVQSQLEGKAFLSAFEQLKGGGAISEKEGEKAQQAIARMSLSQSEKEYRQGLKEYKEVMQAGLLRMKGEKPKDDAKPKSLQDFGYNSNDDVLRDAKNTIMRNPQARGEVEKRLQSMGLSLGSK